MLFKIMALRRKIDLSEGRSKKTASLARGPFSSGCSCPPCPRVCLSLEDRSFKPQIPYCVALVLESKRGSRSESCRYSNVRDSKALHNSKNHQECIKIHCFRSVWVSKYPILKILQPPNGLHPKRRGAGSVNLACFPRLFV